MENIFKKFKGAKFTTFLYPLLIVIAIPLLLVINTLWNLKSFNRDANFIVRHQATSLAEAIKPEIISSLDDPDKLKGVLTGITNGNEDIISSAVLIKEQDKFNIISSSETDTSAEKISDETLNNFAVSTNKSYAGLTYDPFTKQNVWKVSVPLVKNDQTFVLALVLATKSVDEILSRTSKDSLILLTITLVIVLALLINHLIFYKKSLRAQQLEEIDRLKDEFISMASHELRAPVTGLVGYLELLKDKLRGKLTTDIQADFSTLSLLTENLQKLINDLLEVSRIEQGRIKVNKTDTDINQIINNVVIEFTPLINEKSLKLSVSAEKIPMINSDPEKVTQILTNLISNAIKYSLKGEILISARIANKSVEISVKDSGIGIPAEEMPKLFGKFHRVKDAKTAEVRGTGLGLWITKQLAQSLGGNIYAESIYGTGSSFTLTLPLSS